MTQMLRPFLLVLLLCACRAEGGMVDEIDRAALPEGPVVDAADLIPPEQEFELDRRLREYWDEEGTAIVVSTTDSLGERTIEDYAFDEFNTWGIGSERDNRGVLVLVAPTERQARIEVGCGLETVLTDPVAQRIMDEDLIPAFRAGDFPLGITAGVEAIIEALHTSEVEPGPLSPICLGLAA